MTSTGISHLRFSKYSGRHGRSSRHPGAKRLARIVVATALAGGTLTVLPASVIPAVAATGDGTVQVRVVQDAGANGYVVLNTSGANAGQQTATSKQVNPPLSSVTVTLADADGHTLTATTDNDGIATFDPASSDLTGGQYRVDVTNPKPDTFAPGFAANNQKVPSGLVFTAANGSQPSTVAPVAAADLANANNEKFSSDTEFVDVTGGKDAYVNTSFWYPAYYCQNNATICDADQPWDAPPNATSPGTERTLISATYDLDQPNEALATKADTGAVYGIAYDRTNQRIFSAAYAKRGSAYGPGGPGGIYVTDLAGTTQNGNDPAQYPLSGTTTLFATVPDAGADNHDMNTHQDYGFFDHVGKESLGDIDVTNDGRYLFGVNMFNKTVFVYDLQAADPAASLTTYPIPNPCTTAADWHPMATGTGMDTNYIGGVCSVDTSPSASTSADMDALSAHVYQLDVATGSFGNEVLDQSLAYDRGRGYKGTYCDGSVEGNGVGRWYAWVDAFPAGPNPQRASGCDGANGQAGSIGWMAYPEPMLDDIVEETDGDLTIAFRDRFADQAGFSAQEPNANGTFSASGQTGAGGDILRGCKLTDGSFVLDPNYNPATDTLAPGSVCTNNNIPGANNGGEPTSYQEYYTGDWRTGYHEEAFYGGIALSRSEPNIVSSGFDSTGDVWTQGISAVGRDGQLPAGNLGLRTDQDTVDQFGKGSGMADLEVLCDQAPIQIGNRVWADTDGDGTQDAGEPGIAGVTVNLYDADGNVVGTTTTDSLGDYNFDDSNVTGGLSQNTKYTVKLDNADDYATGGPLAGRTPTKANAGDNDEHDSDGVVPTGGQYPQAAVTTGGAGQDDHTYDFGFVPPVSIGDKLWIDTDGDGVQDSGEPPVPNATVTLLDADGNTIATTTTDANGNYAFTDLPPNTDYTVQFPKTVTVGGTTYFLTQPTQDGDTATDSNPDQSTGNAPVTTPASGNNSDQPGQEDNPTIDAGYAPPVSIGDYVWLDENNNGIQDAGEAPVPNATVTLLDADGNTVATTTTDANGYYAFTDLTPNTDYTVQFPTTVTVDGIDYALSDAVQGSDRTADSNPNPQSGAAEVTTPRSGNNSGAPGTADDPTIDAGYHPKPVSIGDYVWIDSNGNGVQDAGEKPVPNATVDLLDADGNTVATTTTDSDGYYGFTGLVPNSDYTVQFPTTVTDSDGNTYVLTTPIQGGDTTADSNADQSTGQAAVTTPKTGNNSGAPGKADNPTIDAGYAPVVSIGDYVWIDSNGNGVQDKGEAPVPGATVKLLDADGNTVATTTTDADGFYAFADLPGNTDYSVQFPTDVTVDGIDYTLTQPKQGSDTAKDSNPDQSTGQASVTTPKAGQNLTAPGKADNPTIDAGYVAKPVSIGDYVWLDANNNGVQDAGEKPVPNATVTLLDADGNTVATTTTDANGYYAFTDLAPNTDYTVQFPTAVTVGGINYALTLPGQGSDAGLDSNPSPSTGNATVTTPKTGNNSGAPGKADNPTIDAGYVANPVSIGDYLWLDSNGNGVQDKGEKPVPGATVKLLDADGNVVATTKTDKNGYYSFTGLVPDTDYTVQFPTTVTVDGVDYALTKPAQGANRAKDSNPDQQSGQAAVTTPKSGGNSGAPGKADNPTIDAGYFPKPVSIGDYLWLDTNGNGVQDKGEAPVPGATVKLLDADGNVVATTKTDKNGYYSFTGLVPNTKYTVQFPTTVTVDGAKYALTKPTQGTDRATDSNPNQESGKAAVTTPKSGDNSGAPGKADNPTIDAGYVPLVSVGSTLWIDANGNGVQDKGEKPVPDTTVKLLDADGHVVATTKTDEDGHYTFTDLLPDTKYYVQFPKSVTVDGTTYDLTKQEQGDSDTDSNPDPKTGLVTITTPAFGANSAVPGQQDIPHIDAGYVPASDGGPLAFTGFDISAVSIGALLLLGGGAALLLVGRRRRRSA